VLPFKGALFRAAEKANVPILPLCIQYQTINRQPITPSNRDLVYYYGDIEFFPHLIKLFFVKRIDVKVEFLKKITSGTLERKELVD
jgi:1-acyl-sn-glycerol-3-phosphate acyltransferase